MSSSSKTLFSAALVGVAGLTVLSAMATAQTVADHDKVVSCYVGTWAFYR